MTRPGREAAPLPQIPAVRLIPILALLAAFAPLAIDMYLSAFVEMAISLRSNDAGVAATLSIFLLGLSFGQLIYGPLSDRFGRRKPLLAGTILFCFASILCLLANDIVTFTLARLLQALGGSCGVVLGRAIVRDLYGETDLARIFSTLSIVSMVAPIIAPSLGIGIIMIGGWRAIFVVLLFTGMISIAAIWFCLPETLPASRRRTDLSIRSILRVFTGLLTTRRFVFAALMTASASGILFSFITGSSNVFITHFGVSKPVYGMIFSSIVLAMIGGGQISRLTLRRLPSSTILQFAFGVLLAATLMLVITARGDIAAIVLLLIVTIAAVGVILPNGAALAISASGDHAGSAASLLGVLQFGAGFVASTIIALLQHNDAEPLAFVVLGFSIVGRMAFSILHRK